MVEKLKDPQVVIQGTIKQSRNGSGEFVVAHLNLGLFQLVFICNLPNSDEQTTVPIYVKWRVRPESPRPEQRGNQTPADLKEAREEQ